MEMDVITLTSDLGRPVEIKAGAVKLIRPALSFDVHNNTAKTFIDYAFRLCVREDAATVAAKVKAAGVATLIKLNLAPNLPLWCDGKACVGPVPRPLGTNGGGELLVHGKAVPVMETPAEIQELLANVGTVLPIIDPNDLSPTSFAAENTWDWVVEGLRTQWVTQ
jgi:hypothetical protein